MKRLTIIFIVVIFTSSVAYSQARTAERIVSSAVSQLNVGNPPEGSVRFAFNAVPNTNPCTAAAPGATVSGALAMKIQGVWVCFPKSDTGGGGGLADPGSNGIVKRTALNTTAIAGASDLPSGIDAAKLADGSVSNAELQFINSLTSNAQTQISAKQTSDADLTDIAGLSPVDDDVLQRKSGVWMNRTPAQLKTDLVLVKADVGLGNVVNADTTTTANITDSTNKRFITDAQQTVLGNTSGTNTGDQTSVTGNAGTATALQTARTINGVSFDGTANITVTAAGSTLSDTVPISKGGTGQTTASAAFNALAPSKTGNSLKVLRVNSGETDYELATVSGGITNSATNGQVAISNGTNIVGDADLTFATDTLTVTKIAGTTFTGDILASVDGTPSIGAVADNRFKMFPAGISLGGPAYQAGEARFGGTTNALRYQSGFVQMGSAVNLGWVSSDPYTTAEDVNFTRASAGVIQVGDGGANANGKITMTGTTLASATAPITFSNAAYQSCTALTTNASGVLGCTASSSKVKQNILPFGNFKGGSTGGAGAGGSFSLNIIRKIQPMTFSYRPDSRYADGGRTHLGLIAENLKAAHPLLASETGAGVLQPEPLAIQAVTIDAIKTLDARLTALEIENKRLRAQVRRLRRR